MQRDQEHEALKADLHLAQQKLSALASIGHHDVTDDQSDCSSRRSSAEMIDGNEACHVCTDTSVRDCSEVSPSRPDSFVSVDSSMSESTEVAETQRHSHTSSVDDDSGKLSLSVHSYVASCTPFVISP